MTELNSLGPVEIKVSGLYSAVFEVAVFPFAIQRLENEHPSLAETRLLNPQALTPSVSVTLQTSLSTNEVEE